MTFETNGAVVYQAVLENSREAVVTVGLDQRVQSWSSGAERLYGWSGEEAIGKPWLGLVETEGGPAPFEALVSRLGDEQRVSETTERLCKDGVVRPVAVTFALLRNAARMPAGVLELSHDATELYRAQAFEATHARLQALESLVHQLSDAVIVTDAELRIVEYTGNSEQIYGFTREEAIGKSLALDFESEFPFGVKEEVRRRLAAGEGVRSQFRVRRKDGTWADLDLCATPFRDPKGSVTGWLSVARDIGEQATAKRALAESEERLRSIVTAMAEGVVLHNASGQIVYCNGSAERILGLSLAQMQGRLSIDPRWNAMHEDGSPFPGETHPAMVTLRTGERCSGIIMGVQDPGGALRWISIASEPLRHSAELAPYAVVATFADVTDDRLAQVRLAESECRYRLLFENLHEEVTVFELLRDGEGHIVDWILRESNRQARRYFGDRYPTAIGRRLTEIAGEASMRPHIEKSGAILRGEVEPRELYIAKTDRHYRSTLFSLDANTVVAAAIDITDRKRAEEAAQAARVQNEKAIVELREALGKIKTLSGLLPICMFCKKIRDVQGYWERLESYLSSHTNAMLSHGLCPECAATHFPEVP